MQLDLEVEYEHHDLMIELGKVEMAMERLEENTPGDRGTLRPILESRLTRLRKQLGHLNA
ncbi:MAG: hypothetical protein ABI379_05810 [Rhodanobacter sp.]